jgi:Ca2+-binding RTX toxin-like protein
MAKRNGNLGDTLPGSDWEWDIPLFYNPITGTDNGEQLEGTDGRDLINGKGGVDYLYGMAGDDWLRGGDGGDYLIGGLGNDYLDGQNGNDNLRGNAGDDTLIGGHGNDSLEGGLGDDILTSGDNSSDFFVYRFSSQLQDMGHDTITDFDHTLDYFDVDLAIGGGYSIVGTEANYHELSVFPGTDMETIRAAALRTFANDPNKTFVFVADGTDGYLFIDPDFAAGTMITLQGAGSLDDLSYKDFI